MEVKQIIAEIKEKMDQRGGLKHSILLPAVDQRQLFSRDST